MTTELVQPSQLALQLGSHNLAAAAAAIEKLLPKSARRPMHAETLSQPQRKAEFDRMGNHAGSNLALAAMAMRLPQ